jgi:hypothetical protein
MEDLVKMKMLTFWNKFYLAMTLGCIIVLVGWLRFDHAHFNPTYFIFLVIGIPLLLLMFQYRSLRQKEVYWAWVILSALLFGLSFWLKQDKQLILPSSGKNAALGLKGPLGMLISYRIFSWVARKTFSTDLIIPSKYGSYDKKEGRYSNSADLFAFFSYIAIMCVASQF